MKRIEVHAKWDAEAEVWVAESAQVPGLVTEAATAEELEAKLKILIPELLLENGLLSAGESTDIPIRLREERELDFSVRA